MRDSGSSSCWLSCGANLYSAYMRLALRPCQMQQADNVEAVKTACGAALACWLEERDCTASTPVLAGTMGAQICAVQCMCSGVYFSILQRRWHCELQNTGAAESL